MRRSPARIGSVITTVGSQSRRSSSSGGHQVRLVFPPSVRTSALLRTTTTATMTTERTYEGAMGKLGTLISNAESIVAWAQERRGNKELDLRQEMLDLLRRLDLDVGQLSCVHVAGTKGKGSTCAFAESILRRGCGLRTGLYTSPHLVHVRERIRIDGKPLEKDIFTKYFWDTWDRLQATQEESAKMPAYFRFLTLMAFNVFIKEKVDVAVIEVGLGGRTDATNVVQPDACGISSLGYDHQAVLGDTLTEIAYEKAGIMKTGVQAYTVPQEDEAMQSLVKQASLKKVDLAVVPSLDAWGGHCSLGLSGQFQTSNASLAVALCREWLRKNAHKHKGLDDEDLIRFIRSGELGKLPKGFCEGLSKCRWPGRAQIIRLEPDGDHDNETWLYLDGAHTEESMEACAQWFASVSQQTDKSIDKRRVLVFNCKENRSPNQLLGKLVRTISESRGGLPFDAAVFTTFAALPGQPEAISPASILAHREGQEPLHWQRTLAEAWKELSQAFPLPDAESHPPLNEPKVQVVDCIASALEAANSFDHTADCGQSKGKRQTQVLVTGSLYLVGGVLELLLARGKLPESVLDL